MTKLSGLLSYLITSQYDDYGFEPKDIKNEKILTRWNYKQLNSFSMISRDYKSDRCSAAIRYGVWGIQ